MRRETKLVGYFSVILGLLAFHTAIKALFGSSFPIGGSCKAICGLSLLIAEFFGPAYGALVAGFLCVAIGMIFTFVGITTLRGSRSA